MTISLPYPALLVLVGASGSGKSTWARRWFLPSEVVSSDHCRMLVADDESDQSVNRQAFAVFYTIVRARLALRRFTVADSTGLEAFSRARLLELGRRVGVPVHVVAFRASLHELMENDAARRRRVPQAVLARHVRAVEGILEEGVLEGEGYDAVHIVQARNAPRPVRSSDLSERER